MEGEPQPEASGVASARDQASIVYKAAALLVEGNSQLRKRLKVLESTKRIIGRDDGGVYAVLSADGDVQDGKRPSLLLFDELHRFTRKKAETVRTVLLKGMISRSPVVNGVQQGEPLMIQTTTSGDEHESPLWFSEYEYARHVLAAASRTAVTTRQSTRPTRSASKVTPSTGNLGKRGSQRIHRTKTTAAFWRTAPSKRK